MSVEIRMITWFKGTVRTIRVNNITSKEYTALCHIHGKDNVTIIIEGV